MPFEYRVISAAELAGQPRFWQTPSNKAKQFAAALQDSLNLMSAEGWELIDSCREPWTGAQFYIFRGDVIKEPETGFKKMK